MVSLQQSDKNGEQNTRIVQSPSEVRQAFDPELVRRAKERIRSRAALHASGEFDWNSLKRDRDDGRP